MHSGLRLLLAMGALLAGFSPASSVAQAPSPVPPPISVPQIAFTGKTLPLLSVDDLRFLEGTWSATSRDGRRALGTYTFTRILNGHTLTRSSAMDGCEKVKVPGCGRQDLFYVYQDSPGAPLAAISMDSEGRVIHYLVSQQAEAAVSGAGRRDDVIFDSDPAQFGPRVRLRYELNRDLQTGKQSMSGAFEVLQADGTFRVLQQWFGLRQ